MITLLTLITFFLDYLLVWLEENWCWSRERGTVSVKQINLYLVKVQRKWILQVILCRQGCAKHFHWHNKWTDNNYYQLDPSKLLFKNVVLTRTATKFASLTLQCTCSHVFCSEALHYLYTFLPRLCGAKLKRTYRQICSKRFKQRYLLQ